MTTTPRCSIVEVQFYLGENASDTAFMDSQDFLENSEETVNLLMQRARSLAGEQAVKRLVYKDDDGDWCTVNRATLSDVVQFATPTEPGTPVGKIDLRIIVEEVVPKSNSKESDAVTDQASGQELSQEEPAEVEVHMNVACDGCKATPIFGHRYKSLEHDNYNLCQTCFDGSERELQLWVRVASQTSDKADDQKRDAPMPDAAPTPSTTPEDREPAADATAAVNSTAATPEKVVYRGFGAGLRPDETKSRQESGSKQHGAAAEPKVFRRLGRKTPFCPLLAAAGAVTDLLSAPQRLKPKAITSSLGASRPVFEEEGAESNEACAQEVEERTACSTDVQSDAPQDLQAQLEQITAQLKEALDRATAAEEATRQAEKVAAQAQTEMEAMKEAAQEALYRTAAAEQLARNSQEAAAKVQAELQAFKDSSAENVKASMEPVTASARVISSAPLMLGIEAHEEEEARGDISSTSESEDDGICQTYRLGRLMMASGTAETVPASAAIVVKNDGQVQWPATAAVACTSGDCLGFPLLPLGPLQPEEAAEVVMDLLVPARAEPCSESSRWSLVDASTGTSLGPQLVLEMAWSAQ